MRLHVLIPVFCPSRAAHRRRAVAEISPEIAGALRGAPVLSVFGILPCVAQLRISDPRVQVALAQFQASDWSQRSNAFYELVHIGLNTDKASDFPVADGILAISRASEASRAELVHELTELLSIEADLLSSKAAPSSEEFSTYYADLIQAVTTLRDSSSTHVLMRCINTGNMATTALAGFGETALSEALSKLPSADLETRHSLFRLFSQMAEPRNFVTFTSAESRSSLLSVLLAGVNERNPFSRLAAVQGLAYLPSPEAIGAVSRLASDDSFSVITAAGAVQYPVREAAIKALERLTKTQN